MRVEFLCLSYFMFSGHCRRVQTTDLPDSEKLKPRNSLASLLTSSQAYFDGDDDFYFDDSYEDDDSDYDDDDDYVVVDDSVLELLHDPSAMEEIRDILRNPEAMSEIADMMKEPAFRKKATQVAEQMGQPQFLEEATRNQNFLGLMEQANEGSRQDEFEATKVMKAMEESTVLSKMRESFVEMMRDPENRDHFEWLMTNPDFLEDARAHAKQIMADPSFQNEMRRVATEE